MKLPILNPPITRTDNFTGMGKVVPQGWECGPWLGTAPYCEGDCSQCAPGEQCRESSWGDGSSCSSGKKVQCCRFVP